MCLCVRNYLEDNKIDGLYNQEHNCSCTTDVGKHFMRCGGKRGLKCKAANEKTVSRVEMVPVEL